MQSYLSFLSMHNTSTHPVFLFIFSNTIIVNLSNNVVVCHATIPLPPCPPPLLLKFYNFASPFVRTLRNAARQSLCGFWKFCIFVRKISRRVIHARQFVFLKTVNDKTVIFEKRHEKIDKNDSLSLTVFFLSNSTATSSH